MTRSIGEAWGHEASKNFWGYKADEPPSVPPDELGMSIDEWRSMSPGYRREISRQFTAKPPAPQPEPSLKDRKAAVEYAGKKRL